MFNGYKQLVVGQELLVAAIEQVYVALLCPCRPHLQDEQHGNHRQGNTGKDEEEGDEALLCCLGLERTVYLANLVEEAVLFHLVQIVVLVELFLSFQFQIVVMLSLHTVASLFPIVGYESVGTVFLHRVMAAGGLFVKPLNELKSLLRLMGLVVEQYDIGEDHLFHSGLQKSVSAWLVALEQTDALVVVAVEVSQTDFIEKHRLAVHLHTAGYSQLSEASHLAAYPRHVVF